VRSLEQHEDVENSEVQMWRCTENAKYDMIVHTERHRLPLCAWYSTACCNYSTAHVNFSMLRHAYFNHSRATCAQ
jgi:hypothetical protein